MNHSRRNLDDAVNPGHVLITGGTGFIGTAIARQLLRNGSRVSVLTRNRTRAEQHFQDARIGAVESLDELNGADVPDVIVNLAGKNLGSERWNERVKHELFASRVQTTERVVDYIARAARKPRLLISGSAVGYYGAQGDLELSEDSPPKKEYQSELCRQWEEAALRAEKLGVRVCLSRTGVVMGRNGGALAGLVPMFRKGLGAVVGQGDQWVSWIHLHDLLRIFLRCMADETLSGPFNNTAPHPVTNQEFAKSIAQVLHRPLLLRVPGWLLRLTMGEMAHLYLTGQKVIPTRHLQAGFEYRYANMRSALEAINSQC